MKLNNINKRIQIRTAKFKIIISTLIPIFLILIFMRLFLSWNTSLNAAEQEKSSIFPIIRYEAGNTRYEYNVDKHEIEEIEEIDISGTTIHEEKDITHIHEIDVPANSFNGTLFIGDSLTVGLKLYGGLSDADYFCITGIGVNGICEAYMNGIMLDTKLESTKYGTIYIMLGINDIGINRDNYLSSYRALLNYICEKQPDADIIIQSILVVTSSYTSSNPIFNNDEVRARNNALSEIADNDHIFYLDLNNYFMDSNGNLYDNLSTDGCHLSADAYSIWTDTLLNYTIPD